MKSNDEQCRIYIRKIKQWVPCTREQFDDYYRDINVYRRTQMNHGRCLCVPSNWPLCDMDCWTCPYYKTGDLSSLDSGRCDTGGEEMTWLDHLQEERPDLQSPSPEDYVSDSDYIHQILERLKEIMPQVIEIGVLRQKGLSEDAIAEQIGVGRKTYVSLKSS